MRGTFTARRVGVTVLATGLVGIGLPAAAASAKPTITLSGSTSVTPLATKLAKRYVKEKKGKVAFKLTQGGSDVGIADVSRGRVTLGMSSRDPKGGDPGGISFNKISRDAICIITNRANRVGNLNQQQVRQLFSGGVRDWGQIGSATVGGSVNIFVRTAASGTQDAFQKIFLGEDTKVASTASQRASNGLVRQSVRNSRGGIGYVSLAFTKGVHSARYKGVSCTLRNAKSGTYGGTRNFWMVSRGKIKGAAKAWVKWIRSDKDALKITASEWVPLR